MRLTDDELDAIHEAFGVETPDGTTYVPHDVLRKILEPDFDAVRHRREQGEMIAREACLTDEMMRAAGLGSDEEE